jgi:RHS repeat-associated protein
MLGRSDRKGKRSVGHPVDVASGTLFGVWEDVRFPGRMALIWERRFSTSLLGGQPTPLGPGWTTRYFATLTRHGDAFHFFTPEGDVEIFDDPEEAVDCGGIVRNLNTFQELSRRGDQYVVTRWSVEELHVERYVFEKGRPDEVSPLVRIEDVTGQGLEMLRDKSKRLSGVRQRLERRTLIIQYAPGDRIKSVSFLLADERLQEFVRYDHDHRGRLVAAYDGFGSADHYEYDPDSRMTREVVKGGSVFSFRYNEKGQCVRASGLDHYDEKSFRYLDAIRWTEVTDSLGNVTRFQCNASGQVVCEIDPLGAKTQTEYDEHGRIVAQTDPNGATIRYEYDNQGNRSRTIDPLGHAFTLTFNKVHLPLTLTDPIGSVWTRAYASGNRLVASKDPLGSEWRFKYDAHGNQIQATDATGASLRQVFSPTGALLEKVDWEGNRTRFVRNHQGRIVERIGPLNEVTRFRYDPAGNPVEITLPDDSRITCEYNLLGNLTRVTDGLGHTVAYEFGPCGRVVKRTDQLGRTIRYHWGSEPGRLTQIINEKGETYQFDYDAMGRVIREQGFDGRELQFEYKPGGGCVGVVNGLGERIAYEFDSRGKVITETLPDGAVATFDYDHHGNLVSAVNPDCAVRLERDLIGRVIRDSQGDHVVEYLYDAAGNCVQVKTSLGHVVDYTLDKNGLLVRLTASGHTLAFRRNARGEEISRVLPGGLTLEQRYDLVGRLVEQFVGPPRSETATSGGPMWDRQAVTLVGAERIRRMYAYDKAGALISIDDARQGKVSYDYDAAEQLVRAIREKGPSEDFSYDRAGNLTRISSQGEEEVLEYESGNRVVRHGTIKYDYDANGRVIKKIEDCDGADPRKWTFSWNANDELRSITTPDGAVWNYAYDALGRRISKSESDRTIRFVWDQGVILHQIEGPTLGSTWVFNGDVFEPLCLIQGGSIYSVIPDHLRTPRELVDMRGQIVWSARYRSWGEIESQERTGDVDCPIRFPGQWFDEESGLHYNRFRYYDPRSGRFLCQDPIGLRGGLNLYLYAQNPINWTDPFGLTGDQGYCGSSPWPLKEIIEEKDAWHKADKLKGRQKDAYEEIKDLLAQGKPGKNQHDLRGDLAGKKAVDLPGSGKGRGVMRVVYSEETPGFIVIHDVVDYHNK